MIGRSRASSRVSRSSSESRRSRVSSSSSSSSSTASAARPPTPTCCSCPVGRCSAPSMPSRCASTSLGTASSRVRCVACTATPLSLRSHRRNLAPNTRSSSSSRPSTLTKSPPGLHRTLTGRALVTLSRYARTILRLRSGVAISATCSWVRWRPYAGESGSETRFNAARMPSRSWRTARVTACLASGGGSSRSSCHPASSLARASCSEARNTVMLPGDSNEGRETHARPKREKTARTRHPANGR